MASKPPIARIGEVKPTLCGFEWTIPNFVSLSEECYNSPSFSFAGASWKFIICPNGTSKNPKYVIICLFRYPAVPPISLKVSFAIKSLDGKKDRERNSTQYINKKGYEVYGSYRFISRDELLKRASELLPSKVLTVLCSLQNSEAAEDASESCASGLSVVLNEKKVLLDFKELFINKEDCDVLIKVKGEEFSAHKVILKARSSVFKSTFRTDMKEKATGIVEIDDCDPSCFSNFLCFLYCGDEDVISKENVFNLFTVADKYDVQDLREKCLEFMKENLTVETFCDTITVALRHSETELIKLATDFFTKNAAKIVVTIKWQLFVAENATQSNELIVKLLVPDTNLSK